MTQKYQANIEFAEKESILQASETKEYEPDCTMA